MEPSDDKKIEILYNHYAESFAIIQQQVKTRDRFFIGILIMLGIMSFQIALPTQSGTTIADFVKQRLGVETDLSVSFLGSVIWAALLFVTVRYFQVGVGLERHYRYIHALEEDLHVHYTGVAFTREGRFYLSKYPVFSWSVARLYRWVFPAALLVAVTLKIISEFRLPEVTPIPLAVDALICLLIAAASILYFLHINFEK